MVRELQDEAVDYDRAEGGAEQREARRAVERQARELAILNHLSEAISSSLELEDILHAICREMLRVFNGRNVGIALLNNERTKLKIVAFYTEQETESDATGLEFDVHGNDASLFVIQTGEPIVVPDAQFNPITRSLHQVMRKRGTVCLLVVPLLARGEVIGTIGIPSNSQEVFNQDEVSLAQTIASQVASVIDNARLHQSVKQARDAAERELEIGRQIQASFFPEKLPHLSGWHLGAHFISARQVAGDFYDLFPLGNNRIALVLADVCDKGVGAALFMVLFRSLLRAHLQRGFSPDLFSEPDQLVVDPGEVVAAAVLETNNYVAINHARANMFATVFAAIVERDSDSLWYVNCGHDAPVLLRNSGKHERLGATGAAIGMFPDLKISAGYCDIHPGESLIAFTDGVTDARAPSGESFGEERLLPLLLADRSLDFRLDTMKKALTAHIGEGDQYDDITFVGLQRK
jgi:sigma-B regulation protein RsbU (phosphoserine phosphatase)